MVELLTVDLLTAATGADTSAVVDMTDCLWWCSAYGETFIASLQAQNYGPALLT